MAGSRLYTQDFLAPDPREYDPRKCARFFFNGIGGVTLGSRCGDFSLTMPSDGGGSGVTTQVSSFSATTHGFTRMTVPLSSPTANSREWIQDRLKATNSMLLLGDFESDCYARVRFDKSTDPSSASVPRIGFSQGHVSATSENDWVHAAGFFCYPSSTTWIVSLAVNRNVPDVGSGYAMSFDTGVSTADWHVLGVHCNSSATEITFTIDGKIVYQDRDRSHIPSRFNALAGSGLLAEGVVDGNTLGTGICLRGRSAVSAGNESKLDIDWLRVRHFFVGDR